MSTSSIITRIATFLLIGFAFSSCTSSRYGQGPGGAGGWGGDGGLYPGGGMDFAGLPPRLEGVSLYGPGSENVQLHPVEPVYFAFDSSVVSQGEMGKVDRLADIAKQTIVIIAGHTDATGTLEYNRGLGERRAMAVRQELLGRGVSPANIQTISYGEDMLTGQGDHRDRRAEFGAVKN